MSPKYFRLFVFAAFFTQIPLAFAINLAVKPDNQNPELDIGSSYRGLSAANNMQGAEAVIDVGDVLLYRVVEDRDQEVAVAVTESGDIFIPYFGAVRAVGKTPSELAQDIKTALEEDLYRKATVLIARQLAAPSSFSGTVFLSGKINRIGPIQIDPSKDNTVGKLILSAGGFSDFADSSNVRIIRRDAETHDLKTIVVDVAAVIEDGKLDEDVKIYDGDFIIVPKKLINW